MSAKGKTNYDIRCSEIGTAVGCNDLSSVYTVDAANNAEVNSNTGHGIMAERALTLIDRMRGQTSENVGVDNTKNGADRLVDGMPLQTKFYNTGIRCVDACFASGRDGGMYRYLDADGMPIPVEVPKDMYGDAVSRFADKIADGKVPGVTDAADAEKYVKASFLTYENAKNLCRPMTTESLLFDAATGAVQCTFALGISAAAVFIISLSKGRSFGRSVFEALKAGVKVFGLTYVCHMLVSQLARTELFKSMQAMWGFESVSNRAAVSSIREINNALGVVMGGTAVSAQASLKQFAKILSAGFLINLITLLVFMVTGFIRLCAGRIGLREFLSEAGVLIAARVFASVAVAAAAVLIAPIGILPVYISTPICIASACAGGIYGRSIGRRLLRRLRIGKVKV